jgi:malignant T-cell-amplified sequence
MFKKFTPEESISSTSQVKNSVQRSIISQIVETYPLLGEAIESILPKKAMLVGKGPDGMQLVIVNNEVLFYSQRDGPFYPTLRLLHKYPTMMPKMQVDKGAIRFVLGGANIMCPGFTSPGGSMPVSLEAGHPVAIYAEGQS